MIELAPESGSLRLYASSNFNYSGNGMVCALMGGKAHINLFFHRGKRLPDPDRRLEGRGKTVRSLRFTSVKDIPSAGVTTCVKQAVALDKEG